jgi:hypothetical protein
MRTTKAERQASKARIEAQYVKAEQVVATGICPDCGTGLIRNLALTGWWQCGGYASEGFRRPGFENAPKCSFQIFTRN